jgi:hypothetical protein
MLNARQSETFSVDGVAANRNANNCTWRIAPVQVLENIIDRSRQVLVIVRWT